MRFQVGQSVPVVVVACARNKSLADNADVAFRLFELRSVANMQFLPLAVDSRIQEA